jgi:hypothetical protein
MSTRPIIYVGPFLKVPAGLEWDEWEHLVSDCRIDFDDDFTALIPNKSVPGIERNMEIDPFGEMEVFSDMGNDDQLAEVFQLVTMIDELLRHLIESKIGIETSWGIVPYLT